MSLERQLKLSLMIEKAPHKPWAVALLRRVNDRLNVWEMLDEGLGYDDIALIMEASDKTFSRDHVKALTGVGVRGQPSRQTLIRMAQEHKASVAA